MNNVIAELVKELREGLRTDQAIIDLISKVIERTDQLEDRIVALERPSGPYRPWGANYDNPSGEK
jgi:hypothetical protein